MAGNCCFGAKPAPAKPVDERAKPKVVSASSISAEQITHDGACNASIQVLIGANDRAPNFHMRRFTIGVGGNTMRHTHDTEHEVYVLQGVGEILLDDKVERFSADYVVFVPGGVEHQFRNIGDGDLVFLCSVPLS